MPLSENNAAETGAPATPAMPRREWIPVFLLPVLALVHLHAADPGSAFSRFSLFVCLSLIPGTLWRLLGKPAWNIHRACFALGLILFVLDNPDLRPDRESARKILRHWPLVSLGFLTSFSQSLWGALRTHRLLTDARTRISTYESLKLCLSGAFFNIFLPGSTGGDAYRVYALTSDYKTKLGPAIASITLDRLLGLPSLIFVVLLGMILDHGFIRENRLLAGLVPFIAGAALVCAALVCYLAFAGRSRRKSAPAEENGEGGAEEEPLGWSRRTHRMIATNVTRRATLPLALLHGFLSHIACIVSCLCFGVALGVEGVPPLRYFLIVPLAMTINAIPGAPGGVGQGELAMATLLDMAAPGAGNAQAGVVVMLLFRLSNMAVGLLGGAYYALGKRRDKPPAPTDRLRPAPRARGAEPPEGADAWR